MTGSLAKSRCVYDDPKMCDNFKFYIVIDRLFKKRDEHPTQILGYKLQYMCPLSDCQ